MQKILMTTVTALIALTIAIGAAGCGADENAKAANDVDRAFVSLSITLNNNAIAMSEQAMKTSESDAIKTFATDVITARKKENTQLSEFADQLDARTGGEATESELTALSWSDSKAMLSASADLLPDGKGFDDAYLALMRKSLTGSLHVARPEVMQGDAPDVVALAKQSISDRTLELEKLEEIEKL